jgi:AraC-like DNA-binding protein
MIKYNIKNKKIYLRLVASYVLIALIPIVFSFIVIFQLRTILRNEISKANFTWLTQMQHNIDSRVSEIERFALSVEVSPRISNITRVHDNSKNIEQIDLYNALNDFKKLQSTNIFIDYSYIYFLNTEMAISPTTKMSHALLYDTMFRSDELSFEKWDAIMQKKHSRTFITLKVKDANGNLVENIAYLRTIPMDNPREGTATLVVLVEKNKLLSQFTKDNLKKNGDFFVVNNDNQVVFSDGGTTFNSTINLQAFKNNEGIIYDNNSKIVISYVNSTLINWKYVFVLSENAFWRELQNINNVIAIITCIFIIAWILGVYYASKKQYKPINQIIDVLKKFYGNETIIKKDEYNFILDSISTITMQNEELRINILKESDDSRSNFLRNILLLSSDEAVIPSVISKFQSYGIEVCSKKVAVLIMHIENDNKIISNTGARVNINYCKEISNILDELVNSLTDSRCKCLVTIIDGNLVSILTYDEKITDDKNILQSIISKLQEEVRKCYEVTSTVGVSSVFDGINKIDMAYSQAITALEYKLVLGKGRIIFFDDILQEDNGQLLLQKNIEQKLINYIRVKDDTSAIKLIEDLFNNNFGNDIVPIYQVKYFMYNITNVIVENLVSICEDEYLSKLNVRTLLLCDTIFEFKEKIIILIRNVCEYVKKYDKSDEVDLKIKEFVEENYSDINLNVDMIGFEFNVTPWYLSKLFLKKTGETLPNYITNIRIAKAKEMLADKRLNINRIAEKVGYVNSNTFIRVFKKHEGITPGQFREKL